jgi:lambda repressor-like predicted transcriptional regulator
MNKNSSQWGKDVKKAVIDQDTTIKQLADDIGYSVAVVSQVINGRYSNASYLAIARKINDVLGTTGVPERIDTPSDEWCQAVKIALIKKNMSVKQLAESVGVSRDRLSLVVNGKMFNEKIINAVDSLLGIEVPAVASGDS